MQSIAWMAWTPATAVFFSAIALLLAFMTWLAIRYPEAERVGILGVATTRGDRLFLALLGSAFIHLAWIGIFDTQTIATLPIGEGIEISSLWLATALSLVYAAAVFRTV
jgi:predicted small integral membrane protein